MKLKEMLPYFTGWDYLDKRSEFTRQLSRRCLGGKTGRDESSAFDLKTVAKEAGASFVSAFIVASRITGIDLALRQVRRQLAKFNK